MKRRVLLSFFALATIAQLWVPVTMIFSSERALDSGRTFKFRTAPVDPYDAFRGKFVALEFNASDIDTAVYKAFQQETGTTLSYGNKVYALLAADSSGFARVIQLQTDKPEGGYYVPAIVRRSFKGSLRVRFPFSKFFFEEGKAKRAEQLYQQQNRTGKEDSYALVKVGSHGHAVIEDLVLGGLPVIEALQ